MKAALVVHHVRPTGGQDRYALELARRLAGAVDLDIVTIRAEGGLPANVRTQLEAIMDEVTDQVNKMANDLNEGDKKKIVDSGKSQIIKLTKDQQAAWQQAMHPVWKQFEDDIGKDIIDAALKANAGS